MSHEDSDVVSDDVVSVAVMSDAVVSAPTAGAPAGEPDVLDSLESDMVAVEQALAELDQISPSSSEGDIADEIMRVVPESRFGESRAGN